MKTKKRSRNQRPFYEFQSQQEPSKLSQRQSYFVCKKYISAYVFRLINTILTSLLTNFQLCLIPIEYKSFSVYYFMIYDFVKNIGCKFKQMKVKQSCFFTQARWVGFKSDHVIFLVVITSLLFSFLSYSFKLNGFFKANTLFWKSFLTVHVITTEMTQGTNFVIDSGYVLLVIIHNEFRFISYS